MGFSLIREKNLPREGCLQPVSQVKEPEPGLVKAISEAPLLGGGWGQGGEHESQTRVVAVEGPAFPSCLLQT